MLLDSINRTLECVLGAAITTNQITVFATYCDYASYAETSHVVPTVTNGTTPVTIVPAPLPPTPRNIGELTLFNSDTVPAVVTIQLNDAGTIYQKIKVTLPVGSTLKYAENLGWQVMNSAGVVQIG